MKMDLNYRSIIYMGKYSVFTRTFIVSFMSLIDSQVNVGFGPPSFSPGKSFLSNLGFRTRFFFSSKGTLSPFCFGFRPRFRRLGLDSSLDIASHIIFIFSCSRGGTKVITLSFDTVSSLEVWVVAS